MAWVFSSFNQLIDLSIENVSLASLFIISRNTFQLLLSTHSGKNNKKSWLFSITDKKAPNSPTQQSQQWSEIYWFREIRQPVTKVQSVRMQKKNRRDGILLRKKKKKRKWNGRRPPQCLGASARPPRSRALSASSERIRRGPRGTPPANHPRAAVDHSCAAVSKNISGREIWARASRERAN